MKQCVKSAPNIKKTFEKGTFMKTHFSLLSWGLLNVRSLTSKLAGISPRGSWRQATVTWWMAVQAKNAVASRKSMPPCTFFFCWAFCLLCAAAPNTLRKKKKRTFHVITGIILSSSGSGHVTIVTKNMEGNLFWKEILSVHCHYVSVLLIALPAISPVDKILSSVDITSYFLLLSKIHSQKYISLCVCVCVQQWLIRTTV